jgi:putative DNA primase/helicase
MDDAFDRFSPLSEYERKAALPVETTVVDEGELVSPIPADAPPFPPAHHKLGKPTARWRYCDVSGRLLFEIWRFDPAGEQKQFLPITLWRENGRLRWRWKGVPAPRPLYGLERLAARVDAPVVVTEGEKAADAAAHIFPRSVCITSPGGSQGASKTDWSPPAGRRILIWGDCDEPGLKYAKRSCVDSSRTGMRRLGYRRHGLGWRVARWRRAPANEGL